MKRILLVVLLLTGSAYAQKHAVGEEDYRTWKSISNQKISKDGTLITYELKPLIGDGMQYVQQTSPFKLDSFERGSRLLFPENTSFVVFKISPGFDTLRKLKLKKVKKAKWPGDSIAIYDLKNNTLEKYPKIHSFKVSDKGSSFAFLQELETKTKTGWFSRFIKSKKKSTKDKILRVFASYPGLSFEQQKVKEFTLSDDGTQIAYIEKIEDKDKKKNAEKLIIKNTTNGEVISAFPSMQRYKLPIWSESMGKMVFLYSNDTSQNNYEIKIHDNKLNSSISFGDTLLSLLDTELVPSEWKTPSFSKDEALLFFGVKERKHKEPEDTLLEDEKYHLDIWHYEDKKLQARQVKELARQKKKYDLYAYDFKTGTLNQLSDDTLNMWVRDQQESHKALAYSNESYAIESQWTYPWKKDYYLISLNSGETSLIKKGLKYAGVLSSKAEYFTYFNEKKQEHQLIDLRTNSEKCITCSVDSVTWTRDINGMPFDPGPVRNIGFTRDDQFLFQSEWDIWSYDVKRDTLVCITKKQGEKRNIKLSFHQKNTDSVYVDILDSYVSGLNETTKSMHLFTWLTHEDHFDLIENMISPHRLHSLVWSENGKKVLMRKSSVEEYPDIYLTDPNFNNSRRISNANPQQDSVYWPSVEHVKWMSYDSVQLEGLVYLPENYDTSRKYPLLIYYYELNSDNLHYYRSPKPSASIINPIECASNDYIVFIPDIRYKVGYPGRSAYNSIMSGTDFILENFAVDSLKMGLQGQSWGGYQTAQLITMTKRYAAAMAGAPVSNMFSAYGGIRWSSGLNRQFQYEATQSRIGKSIWEAPELYYQNSPIFHLPKVSTPLLIMHNDKDGAVPWYQGIEMYSGMRRLNKPCWMLVYNNDGHNLKKLANKFDLSIRMNQFFDHYLKDEPMPEWMKNGIKAIDKDSHNGYEVDKE